MFGYTRADSIRNVVIGDKVGVTPIEDKMREAGLQGFGHIRKSMDALLRSCENVDLPWYRRGRGRPRNSLSKAIKHNLNTLGSMKDMAQDRKL